MMSFINNKLNAIVLISVLLSIACKDNKTCINKEQARIDSCYVRDSVKVGTIFTIPVYFEVKNGCGQSPVYSVQQVDDIVPEISIAGEVTYSGCVCAEIFSIVRTEIPCKAEKPGIYLMRFLQPNHSVILDTLKVYN